MSRFLFKYNVAARGREGTTKEGNTWSIEDLDTGEIILTDHIEIKCKLSTVERQIEGKGFGMLVENAEIEYREHVSVGKFVVIKDLK